MARIGQLGVSDPQKRGLWERWRAGDDVVIKRNALPETQRLHSARL